MAMVQATFIFSGPHVTRMIGGELLDYLADRDTATHRVCGTCQKLLPLDMFYKDGKDAEDNVRYRRDCKDCYKEARCNNAVLKLKKGK